LRQNRIPLRRNAISLATFHLFCLERELTLEASLRICSYKISMIYFFTTFILYIIDKGVRHSIKKLAMLHRADEKDLCRSVSFLVVHFHS
jgi:hypothetical protein